MKEKDYEIERKFLVSFENMPDLSRQIYMEIVQGYIQNIKDSGFVYRLRQVLYMSPTNTFLGEQYFQTIKGTGFKKRKEYEIELLHPQFVTMWPLCENVIVNKKRYVLPLQEFNGLKIHLDIYKNVLNGLYSIEVEFDTEEECDNFVPPSWFGREVTYEAEYTNLHLALYGLPKNLT